MWSIRPRPAACEPSGSANRVRVRFDAGEEGRMVLPLQPLLDEGAQDDLEAHGEFQPHRRLPCEDSSPGQEVLRQNEEHSGAILQYATSVCCRPYSASDAVSWTRPFIS
jgi:hypothetical protein